MVCRQYFRIGPHDGAVWGQLVLQAGSQGAAHIEHQQAAVGFGQEVLTDKLPKVAILRLGLPSSQAAGGQRIPDGCLWFGSTGEVCAIRTWAQ